MTLFDVEMLSDYWAAHPPLGHMIASFLGVKSAAAPTLPRTPDQDQAAQIMALTGAEGMGGVTAPSWEAFHAQFGLATPTFDSVELAGRRP